MMVIIMMVVMIMVVSMQQHDDDGDGYYNTLYGQLNYLIYLYMIYVASYYWCKWFNIITWFNG